MKNKHFFGLLSLVSLLFVSINCKAQAVGYYDNIFGGRKHFFDVGLGIKPPAIPFLDIGFGSDIFHLVPQLAYRFQGNYSFLKFSILYFRSISPQYLDNNYPFAGISFGYTF